MEFHQPVPTLPVRSVRLAQEHYRDRFGFQIAWHRPENGIGAVSHGDCAIFLRAQREPPQPSELWFFVADVDAVEAFLRNLCADLLGPAENKPWGLRQVSARDRDGHLLHFHHDL